MSRLLRKNKKCGRYWGGAVNHGMSYSNIFEAVIAEAKADDELGQIIACISDSSSKVEKICDLYAAYKCG